MATAQGDDGYVLQSDDSERWAEDAQFDHWRQMSLDEKVEAFRSFGEDVQRLHLIGLRELLPGATERELVLEAAAIRVGPDIVRHVSGYSPRLAR